MLHEDGEDLPVPALNFSTPMLWDVTYIALFYVCGLLLWPLEQGSSSSCPPCTPHTPYLAPGEVVLDAVDGERDHLHVALAELGCQLCCPAQLRGAHRSEVPWVGEQDAPPGRGGKELV